MVSFNTFSKLCVVVALGLSAIATSTEVAQEQPKKESFVSRFFGKNEKSATKSHDVSEPTKIDTQKHSDTGHPKYDVEWYLLPKPENRATLRNILPCYLAKDVPEDCNEPISSKVEKRIRDHFSWIWGNTVTGSSSAHDETVNVCQTKKSSLDSIISSKKERTTNEPVEVTEPPMYSVEWYLFPKLENRKHLRYRLPYDLAKFLPRNCNKPIKPRLEKLIRKFFSESLQKQETMRRHFILPLYLKAKLGRS